ncbi:MAG TPA: hypothetical protein DD385_06760, partial [Marinobacter sp.]|nr:hypothetical protein [Marinobacter sp.]
MNTKLSALALATALIPLAHAEPPTPEFTSGGISSRTSPQQPVGTTVKAEADARAQDAATDIASITADRGIVTRPGRFTIEPSFSHAHSNATRVAIEGYTVIPALLIGLINISEVQRDIFVGAVSLKYGFT